MVRRISIFLRHGDYHQLPEADAHQPFPLNDRGTEQARAAVRLVTEMVSENGWSLHPTVHCSTLLRAWQTASIVIEGLPGCETIFQTDQLTERCVGSGANLTRSQLEEIVRRDPRHEALPKEWKTNSRFRLPFIGAESLMDAGKRVADYVTSTVDRLPDDDDNVAVLFVGHGGSFRHAAHHMGALPFESIAGLSMDHACPVGLVQIGGGQWRKEAGDWKVRPGAERMLD